MFSQKAINSAVSALESAFGRDLREYSLAEVEDFKDRLSDAFDKKGQATRAYTAEEQEFVENELLMTKASFEYTASRYLIINLQGATLGPMYPLMDSQKFVMMRIAAAQDAGREGKKHKGLFFNVLKSARQVGVSTLSEAIGAWLLCTQNNRFGLIASDAPGPTSSGFLFGMFERFYDNLPVWLRPIATDRVKETEIKFDGGSHIWVGAGKSMKGAQGARGQLGRGMSLSYCHCSELSTWDNPQQIDDALLPTFPLADSTFVLFESTAKGRNNWWHKHWKKYMTPHADIPEFTNIFIPWYVEPKYSYPAPESWIPAKETLLHAKQIEETSPRWTGRTIVPRRDQLYWYEIKRNAAESEDKLRKFYEEFASIDDDQCFQFSGSSIFGTATIERVAGQARPLAGVLEIAPMGKLR